MDINRREFIRNILAFIFNVAIVACIFIRKSVFSIPYTIILAIFPFSKTTKGRNSMYLLSLFVGLSIFIVQITLNFIDLKRIGMEIELTASSDGCNSSSAIYLFDQLGFAWLACDAPLTICRKIFTDFSIVCISAIAFFYNFLAAPRTSTNNQLMDFNLSLKERIFTASLDIFARALVLLISLFNPNITSFIYFFSAAFYPMLKAFSGYTNPEGHHTGCYILLSRFSINIFYFVSFLYLNLVYVFQFPIVKSALQFKNPISNFLNQSLFLHIDEIGNDPTSFTIISLHSVLLAVLYVKILLYYRTFTQFNASTISFNTNSFIFHLKILIGKYSHLFSTVLCLILAIRYNNYLAFPILFISLLPFIYSGGNFFKITQKSILTLLIFLSVIFQYILTFFYSRKYTLHSDESAFIAFGTYTSGYAPGILAFKYIVFLVTLLSFNSTAENSVFKLIVNRELLPLGGHCRVCKILMEESWLISPNVFVQFFTYLLTVFSRPIICVYPLIELYHNRSNVHTTMLLWLFLLLSVSQTKKRGWEVLQKVCLYITNTYMFIWIVISFFIRIFGSLLNVEKINHAEIVLDLFDLQKDGRNFWVTSTGWLLASLIINNLLLTYYSSVLISSNVIVLKEGELFQSGKFVDLMSAVTALFMYTFHYFLKIMKFIVISRRFIISLICFIVSLVRPSLLTFLTFSFSCVYATNHRKKINRAIASILIVLSTIVVFIMVVYQSKYIHPIVFSPIFRDCTAYKNESSISTGLSKTDSFSPIFAFLGVVFIFSFLNSLSRYYERTTFSYLKIPISGLRTYLFHITYNFLAYWGYESIIITGVLAAVKHGDLGSLFSMIFVGVLIASSPYLYGYRKQSSPNFIRLLQFYKYLTVFIMIVRYSFYICSIFLTCWIKYTIYEPRIFDIIFQLLIKRTFLPENRMVVIFDFIHLLIVRIYARNLVKTRLEQLDKEIPDTDFTLRNNGLEVLKNFIYSHFIHLLFATLYLVAFCNIHLINVSYMIGCGFIIVYQQKRLFSSTFKIIIRILTFLPIIIIFSKIFIQLFFCLDPTFIKSDDDTQLLFFLGIQCPNSNYLTILSILPDLFALLVILIQTRIYLSTGFNYLIVNHYMYYLESIRISSTISKKNETNRADYEHKLHLKQKIIEDSIEAIKKNINLDFGINIPRSKTESLYGVDKDVFEKFYQHRDGQTKIFDDYNDRAIDDYIPTCIDTSISRASTPPPSQTDQNVEAESSTLKQKFISLFSEFKSFYNECIKYVEQINEKERAQQKTIRSTIKTARITHSDEIKRILKEISPDFEYANRDEQNSSEETLHIDNSCRIPESINPLTSIFEIVSNFLTKNTDFIVFFAMAINNMYSANIFSMTVIFSYFLYASIVVPRPPHFYWRCVSLFVLISVFARYTTSIYPLNTIFACSSTCQNAEDSSLCLYRLLGIDSCENSSFPALLLLIAIQIHLTCLHYRGLLVTPKNPPSQDESESSTFCSRCKSVFRNFMKNYETGVCTVEPDYYVILFITQLGQWIVIAFYWSSFIGPSMLSGDITEMIKRSVIPASFSILITFQSFFIVADRFINLNRMRSVKLIYTIILFVTIHIYIFLIVPQKTQKSLMDNPPVLFFYVLYCVYFYFSFIPVRNGYNSTNVMPYSITQYHNYCSIGLIFAIIYSPFVYELDTVLRWFSSTTSLGFFQYIKIDEIFFNMHICKSFRKKSIEQGEASGIPYSFPTKLLITIFFLLVFFVAILLPLWLYSTGVTAIQSVLPSQIDFSISINGHFPLYESTVVKSHFKLFKNHDEMDDIMEKLMPENNYYAQSVLLGYKEIGDIIYVEFAEPSYNSWAISTPARALLIEDIKNNISQVVFRLRFKIYRESPELMNVLGSEKVEGAFVVNLSLSNSNEEEIQKYLINALEKAGSSVLLQNFLPYTIRVEPSKPLHSFDKITTKRMKHVCAHHESNNISKTSFIDEWWKFTVFEETTDFTQDACQEKEQMIKNNRIGIFFFIDFLKSSRANIFSPSKNAIGLYVVLITTVSTIIKKFFLNTSHLIMYREIPNPDYLLNLCRYIYRARWSKNLELEEFFVSILFYLFRSPEDLIRVTHLEPEIYIPVKD